jgi:hypothetical protein
VGGFVGLNYKAAIVRQQGQVVLEGGRTDEEIEFQEGVEGRLALCRLPGVVHALIEFSQGHDAHGQALGPEFRELLDHALRLVQMVNDPVRIHRVSQGHSRGSGRVATRRSA